MDTFLLFILLLVVTISAMIKTNELENRIEELENKKQIKTSMYTTFEEFVWLVDLFIPDNKYTLEELKKMYDKPISKTHGNLLCELVESTYKEKKDGDK